METSGIITVQDVVDEYLSETKGKLESAEDTIVKIIERGMSHLSMFILEGVNVQTVKVNTTLNTAYYPKDLRRLIRLGVKQTNGHLYTLTRDDELVSGDYFACETPVPTNTLDDIQSISAKHLGRRGGFSEYGSYKKDDKGRRVILSPEVTLEEVVFEYVGSGVTAGTISYFPATTMEALIAFTKWKTSSALPQNLRLEYKQEWNEAQIDLRTMSMPSMDEILDAIRQSSTQIATRA